MLISNGALLAPSSPLSLADSTPGWTTGDYHAGSTLPLLGAWAAYGELYRRQLWVGIVIRKLAWGTARLPLDVNRSLGPNSFAPEAGNLTSLLARPNDRLSGFMLWLWTSATFDIYGEAFWLKLRDRDGRVREIHPMHPTNLVYRRDQDTGEYFWHYSLGTRTASLQRWPEADIVPFLSFNPDNITRGVSNLEGLRETLTNEDASRRATAAFWRNGSRPSVALTHPGELSEGAAARIKKTWESNHAGADLMGGTAILEEGMKPEVLSLSAEEMQYIDSRKLNREEVCAAYDVSPLVVHILDRATYSNVTAQLRSQYRDTMAPRLGYFESVLMHHLVPDFYPAAADVVSTRFNMDEVMRGDFETRADAANKLTSTGVMKPSEARPMFNLPDADDPAADFLYANAATVRLGEGGHQPVDQTGALIPAPANRPATSPAKQAQPARAALPQLDLRSVKRRLGRVKAAGGDARSALVAEHEAALVALFAAQVAALAANPSLPLASYDAELAGVLAELGLVTSKAIGDAVAGELGGTYDGGRLADWIQTDAVKSAALINAGTATAMDSALAARPLEVSIPDAIAAFGGTLPARAAGVALSRVTRVAGLSQQVAAEQAGAATKTWEAGDNPRESHAAMDGETVGLDETFSNGMNGPGDPAGGADEVAGCNCSLVFDMP